MTPDDEASLAAILPLQPDLVALSFVQSPADVLDLHSRLDAAGATRTGIVLKIETAAGFSMLPLLLLTGLRRHAPLAIMLARGDLGVEVGFARMSEVQEELLWLCEAAHVPVIWATQVLESLAKGGIPTRGDVTGGWGSVGVIQRGAGVCIRVVVDSLCACACIFVYVISRIRYLCIYTCAHDHDSTLTYLRAHADAAASSHAEAVMLNKGKYMPEVLAFIDDVLARSAGHTAKQRHMLRELSVATHARPLAEGLLETSITGQGTQVASATAV